MCPANRLQSKPSPKTHLVLIDASSGSIVAPLETSTVELSRGKGVVMKNQEVNDIGREGNAVAAMIFMALISVSFTLGVCVGHWF